MTGQPGAAWRLDLQGVTIPADKLPLFSASPSPERYSASGEIISGTTDVRGRGVLTLPSAGSSHRLICYLMHAHASYEIPAAEIEMDKGFDPRKIKGAPEPHPERRGAVLLKDAAGHSAVVDGVDVLVDAGPAVLRFPAKGVPTAEALVLRGVAVDEAGKGIKGVKFTAAIVTSRGGGMCQVEAITNAQGDFELRDVLLPLTSFQPDSRIQMLAVKAGFDGAQT